MLQTVQALQVVVLFALSNECFASFRLRDCCIDLVSFAGKRRFLNHVGGLARAHVTF